LRFVVTRATSLTLALIIRRLRQRVSRVAHEAFSTDAREEVVGPVAVDALRSRTRGRPEEGHLIGDALGG
jgi:hypothetical protein